MTTRRETVPVADVPHSRTHNAQHERSLVVQALECTGWNQTPASVLLRLNRDQIRYRIEKCHLERVEKLILPPHRRKAANQRKTVAGTLAHPLPLTRMRVCMGSKERVESVSNRVRPFLQAYGGDIELMMVTGNSAEVRLTGICAGCPSAHMPLTVGVEAALRRHKPLVLNGVPCRSC